jgi:hypothetical protein
MKVTGPAVPPPRVPPPSPPSTVRGPGPGEPSLWSVLTPEEREFFSPQAIAGPLTYRPGGPNLPDPAAPTGRRLDVRA